MSYRLFLTVLKILGSVRNFGLNQHRGRKLILCYHDISNKKWAFSVTKKEFEKQMKYLADNFSVVSLDEILKNDKPKTDQIAITFDDGYVGVIKHAFPVMKKLGIVGTVFAVGKTDISTQTGYKGELLSSHQLRRLKKAGWEIGWHSRSHQNLNLLGRRDLLREIGTKSKSVRYFAYPFGSYDFYVSEMVKKIGYTSAFSVDGKAVNTDGFSVSRITVSSGIKGIGFAGLLCPAGVLFNGLFTSFWRKLDNFRNTSCGTSIVISSYEDVKNPNYGGGGARAIHEMAKRISLNFRVKVISWNHSGVKKELIDNVYYEHIGFKRINPKLAQVVFATLLPFLVVTQRFAVWIESFGPPFTTAFLPLFGRKNIVGVMHMFAAAEMKRKYKLPFGLIEKMGLRMYKNIIATSSAFEHKIHQISPNSKIAIIENGVEKVKAHTGKRKKQILFLGRLEVEQKGLDLLVEGFKKFSNTKQGEGYKLIFAGNGTPNEFNKLKHLVREAGIRKSVIFAGRVEGKQKEKLFESSKCMIVSSRFETFGMVALEAMAYGLPVIAFDIDGLTWTPKDAVVKVPPFDTDALAQAVENIVDESMAKVVTQKGINFARKFTWEKIAIKYESYLGEFVYQ